MSMIDNIMRITGVKIFLYFILTPVIIACITCCPIKKTNSVKRGMRGINLAYSFQLFKENNGQVVEIKDTIGIVYYGSLILYIIPYYQENSEILFDSLDNILEEKVILDEKRFAYFIQERDSKYGFLFDSLTANSSEKLQVDSLLRTKIVLNQTMFTSINDSLVEVNFYQENPISLMEKYIPRVKYDLSYADSVYLYYTKELNEIPFSLSETLDARKKMKLFKAKFIHNPVPKGIYAFELPRRELVFEIGELNISDQRKILTFFKRFKQYCSQ